MEIRVSSRSLLTRRSAPPLHKDRSSCYTSTRLRCSDPQKLNQFHRLRVFESGVDRLFSFDYAHRPPDHLIARPLPINLSVIRVVSASIDVAEILNPSCPQTDDCGP